MDGLVWWVRLRYKNLTPDEASREYDGKGYTVAEQPVQRLMVIAAAIEEKTVSWYTINFVGGSVSIENNDLFIFIV